MSGFFDAPTYRQGRPVLLVAFTNKVCSIGLGLIPILLVEKGVSTGQGTLVLSTMKAMVIVGSLAGGALSDRFGARSLTLAALLMSATGLGFLPFTGALGPLIVLGVLAQLADATMNVVQRLLLMDQVQAAQHKEALGWMRMVSNMAQIFSYSIATLGAGIGIAPLMVLDATTSLLAFGLGTKILPRPRAHAESNRGLAAGRKAGSTSLASFLGCSLVFAGWSFFYELFLAGGAGRLEVLHPGQGLRRFASTMVLNTVLCTLSAVHATRFFRRSWTAIAWGLAITAVGLLTAAWGMASQGWVFFGMLLITLGELMLAAVSQYVLMRLTPGARNAGFYYSVGVTITQCGRIAGAAAAFPLLIHADSLGAFSWIILATLAAQVALLTTLKTTIDGLD